MNRIVPLKFFAAASLALGTLAATTAAQARDNVQFSVTLGNPGVLVQSVPVYVHPGPPMCGLPRPMCIPAPFMCSRNRSICVPVRFMCSQRQRTAGATNATTTVAVTSTPKALGATTTGTVFPTAMTAFQPIRIAGEWS